MDWNRMKTCPYCGEDFDYTEFTTEGLCPSCADRERERELCDRAGIEVAQTYGRRGTRYSVLAEAELLCNQLDEEGESHGIY